MSEQESQQEPTMEEILASIRRIISEDDQGDAGEDAPAADFAEESAPEEVMELTNVVHEDGTMAAFEADEAPEPEYEPDPEPDPEPVFEAALEPEPEPDPEPEAFFEPEPEPIDDLVLVDDEEEEEPAPMPDPIPEPIHMPDPAPEPAPVYQEAASSDGLMDEVAAGAAAASFGALSRERELSRPTGPTLEAVVQQTLQPLLKEWLDENLPQMVEDMVRDEIERLSKRRS